MDHQNDSQSTYTPYAPPAADVVLKPGMEEMYFIPGSRSVPIGNAFTWISNSWGLFKQRASLWIGFIFVYMLLLVLLSLIPFIGSIIAGCVQILLGAGVIYSCDLFRREGSFTFGDLFAAFNRKTGSLLILYLIAFGLFLVAAIIVGIIFGVLIGTGIIASENFTGGIGSISGLVPLIVIMVFSCAAIYVMAIWFAPALVMMHDVPPFKALKMSFSACLKNILPGIVFFLAMTVLLIISTIPLFLGLLVTIPMYLICYYTSYQDIFFNKDN
jgi:uncharacterized membrane protein